MALAFAGAILAFALNDSNADFIGVEFQPLGGILLATGALLVIGDLIVLAGNGNGSNPTAPSFDIKAIGGLIAVIAGIVAVSTLAVVTITVLSGNNNKESIVAITSSAFGVISAVVGAYLGIKITADTTGKATEEAKHAAVAEHEANAAQKKSQRVDGKLDELVSENKLTEDLATELKVAGVEAEQEARDASVPSPAA